MRHTLAHRHRHEACGRPLPDTRIGWSHHDELQLLLSYEELVELADAAAYAWQECLQDAETAPMPASSRSSSQP
ncbi:hypothetical protein ACWGJ2_00840 [Streptomyces sp. NPDC054796]